MIYPIQPLEEDKHGILRFKKNEIVVHLLDNGGIDMNQIASLEFPQEDREQFAQLIGYSLSSFGELSYVSDETFEAVCKMYENGLSETDARNEYLRGELDALKKDIVKPIARLFGICPEDLQIDTF